MPARARDRAKASLAKCADPTLLSRLERHRESGRALLPREQKPDIEPRVAPATLGRFRLGAWRLRLAGEPRELERPPQIADDLQHRTPQAILRDLHRPVRMIPPIRLRTVVEGQNLSAAGVAVREAMTTSYTVRIGELPNCRAIRAEAWRELRAVLAAPWERARPEGEARRARLEPGPEDALWFGSFGGVDPDQ